MTKRRMEEIDELIYQHNKRMAIEALYDDEMAMVESYTRAHEISDSRAPCNSK